MNFEKYEHTIGTHWAPAIENGDESGLSDYESAILAAYLAKLPGRGHWVWGDVSEFAQDDISGLYGDCYVAAYLVRVAV